MELEITPWIWRIDDAFSVTAHTGVPALARRCLIDEAGRVFLETDIGFGLVHSMDMLHAADAIESGRWSPESVSAAALPARFGYVVSPQSVHDA